ASLPRPRLGSSRGWTRRGRAGRPGMRTGPGAGASSGTTSSPRRKAAAAANVVPSLASTLAAARQAWAASIREPGMSLGKAGLALQGLAAGALGGVGAQLPDPLEVVLARAGDILAVEAGAVETGRPALGTGDRVLQVGQVLEDQPVDAQQRLYFLLVAAVGDELLGRRQVDAVDVGVAHRRRGGGQVDLARAHVPDHLHDLPRSRAAHDRIVHQQHHPVAELQRDRIELAPHRLRALLLAGHDERAPDIAVLHEALAVLHPEHVGDLQRGIARGVRDRDHGVDVVVRPQAQDLLAQLLAHAHARLVDRDLVDHRVRTRQVDVFEDARGVL